MIRFSPTSISLSATDVDCHLQQIDIYHGLLKQGFKKRDVLKYFDEQRKAEAISSNVRDNIGYEMTTTVELNDSRLSSRSIDADAKMQRPSIVGKLESAVTHRGRAGRATGMIDSKTPISAQTKVLVQSSDRFEPGEMTNTISVSLSSPQPTHVSLTRNLQFTAQNEIVPGRHAPRQSSLLRFAKTVSSDDIGTDNSIQYSSRANISYRPRTDTYSYDQSEDDRGLDDHVRDFEQLAIDDSLTPFDRSGRNTNPVKSSLRPDAKEFTPLSSVQLLLQGQPISSNELDSSPSTPKEIRVTAARRTRSSPSSDSTDYVGQFPSSPPMFDRTDSEVQYLLKVSPTLPPMPTTPITPTPSMSREYPETEPLSRRQQYLDGESFSVYNDSLPASAQPQTPAEFLRDPVLTEQNAAYTAPPGMIGRQSTAQRIMHQGQILELGEQSPTVRAIDVRQRRNREFARSTRVEGLRVLRVRGGLHRQTTQEETGGFRNNGNHRVLEEQLNMWRDDLDADRVGEENFEQTETLLRILGADIRVISGNQPPPGR